jgi:hypothetical protein
MLRLTGVVRERNALIECARLVIEACVTALTLRTGCDCITDDRVQSM